MITKKEIACMCNDVENYELYSIDKENVYYKGELIFKELSEKLILKKDGTLIIDISFISVKPAKYVTINMKKEE
ncbi:MAG: hypothetical protein WC438_06000 [Candidatus Pacearchaeota archaeon]|jgi:hypothetical protein